MIKITFIVPYEDIREDVNHILREVNEEGIVFETTSMIGTNKELMRNFDSDIIIARGVTYLALKKNLKNVPVIEIAVSCYDFIRAIDECKRKLNAKKIAIIGSETMIFGTESLERIMGVKIKTFKINDEKESLAALKKAREYEFDAIIGGLMTFNLAEKLGLKALWIRTGKEAIRQSVQEAINAAVVTRNERAKAELFKIILKNTKEAIVAIDSRGKITTLNRQTYKTLRISEGKKLVGVSIKNILPSIDIKNALKSGKEELGVIDTVKNITIVSNKVPIVVDNQVVGVVITFQNINKIQEIEGKIRKELSKKGLIAKYSFGNILGNSEKLNRTIKTAYKYSQVDSNILIIGETGVGKELFAQSIHNASNRSLEPFVAVNCAALPENLLESELFGYAEGAFSGAVKGGKTGLFEIAHNGTIFLDEVGEISLNLQAKLLRVLQEKEIRRIGGDKVIPINVRIISATNKNLKEKVEIGEFRQDLLFRLDVLNLRIPPLRERKEDIKDIVEHFIEKYSNRFHKPISMLTYEAVEALKIYSWPGNIRELRNICERLVVLSENESISDNDVIKYINYEEKTENNKKQKNDETIEHKACKSIDEMEIETIREVLEKVKYNKSEAAKMLGISRTTLWRKLNNRN